MIFESGGGNDIPILRPDGGIPLPAFDDAGGGFEDQRAQAGKQVSTPIGQSGDLYGNEL